MRLWIHRRGLVWCGTPCTTLRMRCKRQSGSVDSSGTNRTSDQNASMPSTRPLHARLTRSDACSRLLEHKRTAVKPRSTLYPWLLSEARHRVGVVPSHVWNARVNEFNSSKPSKNATSPASRSVFDKRRRADWRRTSSSSS
jgi:hypothetical protein